MQQLIDKSIVSVSRQIVYVANHTPRMALQVEANLSSNRMFQVLCIVQSSLRHLKNLQTVFEGIKLRVSGCLQARKSQFCEWCYPSKPWVAQIDQAATITVFAVFVGVIWAHKRDLNIANLELLTMGVRLSKRVLLEIPILDAMHLNLVRGAY